MAGRTPVIIMNRFPQPLSVCVGAVARLARRRAWTTGPDRDETSDGKKRWHDGRVGRMHGLIERIHRSGQRGVLAVTGGGSQAISDLLAVSGASRSLLAALVPYCLPALSDLIGGPPEHACSAATARAMAMAAYFRAWELEQRLHQTEPEPAADMTWGVGCTASLRSDREKRGEHRLHVAWQTADATETASLFLKKNARSRADEELLAADLVLLAVAAACGVEPPTRVELLPDERLERKRTVANEDWRDLLLGAVDAVLAVGADAEDNSDETASHSSNAIFPGAFHPLHEGHRGMAQRASQRLGTAVEFEISIDNVDKPLLDYTEISERLAQFGIGDTVWLTRAATFVEKAEIFPEATFVVGADTILRIGQTRYYSGTEACRQALQRLAELQCRFLVFGRLIEGRFRTLEDIEIPSSLRELCEGLSGDEFREDISSTQIRTGHSRGS
jgi:hypothetical protein